MIRLPEQTDPPIIAQLLGEQTGVVAFDVGANIGQAARVLAAKFAVVYSFEPCAESYDLLINEVPANVRCYAEAVTDHNGTVALTECATSITTGQLTTGGGLDWGDPVGERQVLALTLDAASLILEPPDFVKVDTEGHEVAVIRGGYGLWRSRHPIVLIEVHHARNEQPIRSMLDSYQLERVDHPFYAPGSPMAANHFFLYGED